MLLDLWFAFIEYVITRSPNTYISSIVSANVIVTVAAYNAVVPVFRLDVVIAGSAENQFVGVRPIADTTRADNNGIQGYP